MVKNFKLTPKGTGNQSNFVRVMLHHSSYFMTKNNTLFESKEGAFKGSVTISFRNLFWEILHIAFLELKYCTRF